MKLNPYIEILARALYNKEEEVMGIPVENRELAKDAIEFMNTRTYVARFSLGVMGDSVRIEYKMEDHQDDKDLEG